MTAKKETQAQIDPFWFESFWILQNKQTKTKTKKHTALFFKPNKNGTNSQSAHANIHKRITFCLNFQPLLRKVQWLLEQRSLAEVTYLQSSDLVWKTLQEQHITHIRTNVCGNYFLSHCFTVPHRKLRSHYLGKTQHHKEHCYPFPLKGVVFLCVQTVVWLPVFGIFNTLTDVDACDCTQGLYGHHKTVCPKGQIWEKNPLPHQGLAPTLILCLAF